MRYHSLKCQTEYALNQNLTCTDACFNALYEIKTVERIRIQVTLMVILSKCKCNCTKRLFYVRSVNIH